MFKVSRLGMTANKGEKPISSFFIGAETIGSKLKESKIAAG